jgi:hypothetical protein
MRPVDLTETADGSSKVCQPQSKIVTTNPAPQIAATRANGQTSRHRFKAVPSTILLIRRQIRVHGQNRKNRSQL